MGTPAPKQMSDKQNDQDIAVMMNTLMLVIRHQKGCVSALEKWLEYLKEKNNANSPK
jgi:hypothetical protein